MRVGRRKYQLDGTYTDPVLEPGRIPIVSLTKSTKYGHLSPYCLTDERGWILENIWQGAKIYPWVPDTVQYRSRRDRTAIWSSNSEYHLYSPGLGLPPLPMPNYWSWRFSLMRNPEPVRYPVGYQLRHTVYASVWPVPKLGDADYHCSSYGTIPPIGNYWEDGIAEYLPYTMARKRIYLPIYLASVFRNPRFPELVEISRTSPISIIDVDGPHEESKGNYIRTYPYLDWTSLRDQSIDPSLPLLSALINDPTHPFGHGYCLSLALKVALGLETLEDVLNL